MQLKIVQNLVSIVLITFPNICTLENSKYNNRVEMVLPELYRIRNSLRNWACIRRHCSPPKSLRKSVGDKLLPANHKISRSLALPFSTNRKYCWTIILKLYKMNFNYRSDTSNSWLETDVLQGNKLENIFYITITSLSFLVFTGYLLVLLVGAIKSKG